MLLACVMALTSSAAWPATALAEGMQESAPPATELRYPNRYDFIWRTPPLPHYIVAMSQDDALCDSIAKAFNDASTPEGAPPGSLYSAPMFVKWQHNPRKLAADYTGMDVDVTMADPFNEGRKHPLARFRFFSGHVGVEFFQYLMCEFRDASDLSTRSWKTVEDTSRDSKCKYVFTDYLYHIVVKDSLIQPTFSRGDLNRLSEQEKEGRLDLLSPAGGLLGPEINFVLANNVEYVVLRNVAREVTLVTRFEGRSSRPKDICLIGPEAPVGLLGKAQKSKEPE
jgi:hypothetical protein